MITHVALLRGVNVGKGNRVPMAGWRGLLTGLGYTGVATLLNSGNAVFRSAGSAKDAPARHAAAIADALASELQVEVPVIVKTLDELEAVVAENPLVGEAADHSRLLVAFVQDPRSLAGLSPIEELAAPPERFVVGKRAAYAHCPDGVLKSRAGEALLGKAGREATTRNWRTVLKLQALARKVEARR